MLEIVQFMNEFDRAMNMLDDKFPFLASSKQIVSSTNEEDKVLYNGYISVVLILSSITRSSKLQIEAHTMI